MQRTKLQQMVRSALVDTPVVSTEGFLTEIASKFKKLFKLDSNTIDELDKDENAVASAARSLSKDVKQATAKHSSHHGYQLTHTTVDAKWAIPGLDYKNLLDTSNPTAHLEEMIESVQQLTADTIDVVEEFADALTTEFEKLMNSVMTCDFKKETIDALVAKSNTAVDSIPKPRLKLLQKKRHLPGNVEITASNGKVTVNKTPCKYKSLPTLNVEQADYVATLLGKFTEGPLSIGPFAARCFKAVDERKKIATCETLLRAINPDSEYAIKAITHSKAITRLYWQSSFDETYADDVANVHSELTLSLIQWINASFK